MPYIQWDEIYEKTIPMRTSFYCPINKIDDMKKVMIENGYKFK